MWGTLAAEKFTEGMVPAMSSVYPGKNMPAGVAGDFDKIYLPRPLVRKVHPGRPLMKGETAKKKIDDVPESFHDTISSAPPFDYDDDKPYTVPPYAPDFPLESNMDPQRMHAGYMAAPDIPTATLPAKPKSPWPRDGEEPAEFPADADLRKLSAGSLSDAPFHSTFTSEDMEMSKKEVRTPRAPAIARAPGCRLRARARAPALGGTRARAAALTRAMPSLAP